MSNIATYIKTNDIVEDARKIIEAARNNAVRSVDFCRVQMYWNLGKRIFEEVLQFPTLTNEKARISEKGTTDSGLGLSNRMPYYDVSIIY